MTETTNGLHLYRVHQAKAAEDRNRAWYLEKTTEDPQTIAWVRGPGTVDDVYRALRCEGVSPASAAKLVREALETGARPRVEIRLGRDKTVVDAVPDGIEVAWGGRRGGGDDGERQEMTLRTRRATDVMVHAPAGCSPTTVHLSGPQGGDLTVRGRGTADALRTGEGAGSAIREGEGDGFATRAGGDGFATRAGGDGNAVRRGSGNGDATRTSAGSGDALRTGEGDGYAVRDDEGNGNALRSGEGEGGATRMGSGRGDAVRNSAGAGNATVKGTARGNAVRAGSGAGDARVLQDAEGNALVRGESAGDAINRSTRAGDAVNQSAAAGHAERGGSGRGNAVRAGGGAGDAVRTGHGDGHAWRGGAGRGRAANDTSGLGHAARTGTGRGNAERDGGDGWAHTEDPRKRYGTRPEWIEDLQAREETAEAVRNGAPEPENTPAWVVVDIGDYVHRHRGVFGSKTECRSHIRNELDGPDQREYGEDSMYEPLRVPASREAAERICRAAGNLDVDWTGAGRNAAERWTAAVGAARDRHEAAESDGLGRPAGTEDQRTSPPASTEADHHELRELIEAAGNVQAARTEPAEEHDDERELNTALEIGRARMDIAERTRKNAERRAQKGRNDEPAWNPQQQGTGRTDRAKRPGRGAPEPAAAPAPAREARGTGPETAGRNR